MKAPALALLAAAVAALTALAVLQLRPTHTAEASERAALSPQADPERLALEIQQLREGQRELQRLLDLLRSDLATPAATARVPIGEIEAAVQRALAERGAGTATADAADAAAAAGPAAQRAARERVRQAFDQLVSGNLDWEAQQALWKELGNADLLDDLIALVEARALERPDDPLAQVELGKAYLQKIYKVGSGPEAGTWATKADRQFDKALALDDRNWEARFSKAVSLSFWPPVFGKQAEAIRHFEVLTQQQQQSPTQQAEFAETYLFLGNLHQQSGNHEQALAVWRQGLALFPNHAMLQQQIAAAQGH